MNIAEAKEAFENDIAVITKSGYPLRVVSYGTVEVYYGDQWRDVCEFFDSGELFDEEFAFSFEDFVIK